MTLFIFIVYSNPFFSNEASDNTEIESPTSHELKLRNQFCQVMVRAVKFYLSSWYDAESSERSNASTSNFVVNW